LNRAIELDPKNFIAYTNRGAAKEAKGLDDEAIADFKVAIELSPPAWPHRKVLQDHIRGWEAGRTFREANRLHEAKKYREAIALFKRIVEAPATTQEGINSAYNIACGHALLGEKKDALEWLEKSVDLGWSDGAHLEKDPDLDSLRGEVRYKKILERLQAK
jgi:tetratricopeptide (TPR) repeat protein